MTALRGQRVIVTGGSRGIGRAVVDELLAAGARVAIVSRDQERLAECTAALRPAYGDIASAACDVTDATAASRAIERCVAELGGLDVVVCGVGGAMSAPFHKIAPQDWERMFALNFYSALHVIQAALPTLKQAGKGKIVAIGSTASLAGFPYVVHYCSAKHALLGLVRGLAAELKGGSIDVTLVCPGFTNTDLLRESIALVSKRTGRPEHEILGELAQQNQSGAILEPEYVASVIARVIERDDGSSGEAVII